jgi:uncharacterized protein (UPF0264 family)
VSVRDAAEALAAADAGADFIDLKDPAAGALGGLPPARIAQIVPLLRARGRPVLVSATVGDLPCEAVDEILQRVSQVAACGVDYVKVGITPGPAAAALLAALAHCGAPAVPVLIADEGVDRLSTWTALCEDAFAALMLDTQQKGGGSLLRRVTQASLADFVTVVQASGRMAGLAGALRVEDLPALRVLAPDFAGFRTAVCAGARDGALDPARVLALRKGLAAGSTAMRAKSLDA